ncbi:hypothetical protein NLI96_g8542 [Meripilus lineatus]|uniref:Uncharacterized protein n=1 Tax=Meripilus lineatus TaxID=2056292 RepID=A0AAD5YDW0_9APHY|nr:hypothetical protein NLI96_g8542 [Physisporinus lineatus]
MSTGPLLNPLKRRLPVDAQTAVQEAPTRRPFHYTPTSSSVPSSLVGALTPSTSAMPPSTAFLPTNTTHSVGSSSSLNPDLPSRNVSTPNVHTSAGSNGAGVQTTAPAPSIVPTSSHTEVTVAAHDGVPAPTTVDSTKLTDSGESVDISKASLPESVPSQGGKSAKGKEKAVERPLGADGEASNATSSQASSSLIKSEPTQLEILSSSNTDTAPAQTSSTTVTINASAGPSSASAPARSEDTSAPLIDLLSDDSELPPVLFPAPIAEITMANPTPLQSTKARIKQMVGAAIEEVVKEKLNSLVDDIVDECFLSIAQMLNESFRRP